VVTQVVTKDVPDYALVYGNPAKLRGWVCNCGVKSDFTGEGREQTAGCEACGREYRKVGTAVTPLEENTEEEK
jgi:UDP-2-acetamido-3-amino-2,3-dideoxy-glucuronate N-acetyltransferase